MNRFFKIIFFVLVCFNRICFAEDILTQSYFIWNTGMCLHSDVKPDTFYDLFIHPSSYCDIRKLKNNDIVFIQPQYLRDFIVYFLPKIRVKLILLVNTCDHFFPDCINNSQLINKLLSSDKIIHIFAQNSTLSSHPKVTQIPIGVDFHTLAYGKKAFGEEQSSCSEQEETILACQKIGLNKDRLMAASGDFHFNDTMNAHNRMDKFFGENRTDIYNQLKDNDHVIFFKKKMPRTELWLSKIKYHFSVCPPGNGLDTHRVWEDLILGIIPIVKTSPLDTLYEQFPIVILKDWAEITEENLIKWYKENKGEFESPLFKRKITQEYWLELMDQKRRNH